jgi:translation initiation factor 1
MSGKHDRADSRLAYSTDMGRICKGCGRPQTGCICRKKASAPGSPGDGVVRVSRETKGRKGRGVTLISGLDLDETSLKSLAKRLKAKCGGGGTVKGGIIEIQGDHRDLLVEELKKAGFTAKRAGG